MEAIWLNIILASGKNMHASSIYKEFRIGSLNAHHSSSAFVRRSFLFPTRSMDRRMLPLFLEMPLTALEALYIQ
jgi:hypothetical protein